MGVTHHPVLWSPDVPRGNCLPRDRLAIPFTTILVNLEQNFIHYVLPGVMFSSLICGSRCISVTLKDVLILLPPSEGKTAHTSGTPFSFNELSFPELGEFRSEVLAALQKVSARSDAMDTLAVGASLAGEVERNLNLQQEPAAKAHDIYSGVLYEALGYSTLTAQQQQLADESVIVISGLWGAVKFKDRIPPYRLSMSVKLDELGKLASWWKKRMSAVLDQAAGNQLIVDARSSTYSAAYKPANGNVVAVNVFQLRNGTPKVVSHFAKHTRGEVARFLLQQTVEPATAQELLDLVQGRWDASLVEDKKGVALNILLPEDHQFTTLKKAPEMSAV